MFCSITCFIFAISAFNSSMLFLYFYIAAFVRPNSSFRISFSDVVAYNLADNCFAWACRFSRYFTNSSNNNVFLSSSFSAISFSLFSFFLCSLMAFNFSISALQRCYSSLNVFFVCYSLCLRVCSIFYAACLCSTACSYYL